MMRWHRQRSKIPQVAFTLSLIFHVGIGFYIADLIESYEGAEPFEGAVRVEWVPPPPVKMRIHLREIPEVVTKTVQTYRQKTPSAPSTQWARPSAEPIAEVVVKAPEMARESVDLHREAPRSRALPALMTAAKFEARAETRDTIAPPGAPPKGVALPGDGIATPRTRATGGGETLGLVDINTYGLNLRGVRGSGGRKGDSAADGTVSPKPFQIPPTADEPAHDPFGIGKSIEETRGEGSQSVVYVLETSSSMTGAKLRLAIQALKDALSLLDKGARFNIVTFDKEVHLYAKTMSPVKGENLHQAYRFLDGLETDSGCNLWGGLESALRLEASTVVLISGGDASWGVTDPNRIVALTQEHNTSRARFITIAPGRGPSDSGIHLLKRLAEAHNGQFLLIDWR